MEFSETLLILNITIHLIGQHRGKFFNFNILKILLAKNYYIIYMLNSNQIISKKIHSILFGTLLGDGYCEKTGHIDITRGYKQKEYVYWLYK